MSYTFTIPPTVFYGEGALGSSIEEIDNLGFKNALIVTDEALVKFKLVDPLIEGLDKAGIKYSLYDKVRPNPTVENVNNGLEQYNADKCDFLISFGGGSAHDCAKAIAMLVSNGGKVQDYHGIDKLNKHIAPLVAINTTAGTGSEVTCFSIITDSDRHLKMVLADKNLVPAIAVNDPVLMAKMPKSLTAATGMDALTHAVECFLSINANDVTDACAEKAIVLIAKSLKNAVDDGNNMQARSDMACAEMLAGMAFSNAGLGYVHAMAHQLGGFFDLPHGICNAVLLPFVQEFNKSVCSPRLKKIAELMGADISKMSDEQGADKAIALIRELSRSIGIPQTLSELGVKKEDIKKMADYAIKDEAGFSNPKKATLEEIIQIYEKAL